jgi:hypothetical protein
MESLFLTVISPKRTIQKESHLYVLYIQYREFSA